MKYCEIKPMPCDEGRCCQDGKKPRTKPDEENKLKEKL